MSLLSIWWLSLNIYDNCPNTFVDDNKIVITINIFFAFPFIFAKVQNKNNMGK